ncbi:hypothetical protein [Nocardia donostiensis]|uniref:Uncharacterized protein n=1 Tax=Nocardia donostiensis TaxID=1538463 RepID=A0A1V2TLR0_9NOCA|nr:hypothetical protein [Nocardia donostiensis]ONM50429.1 hypothetical protein B0T46_00410 [Nocardia donostiensis]OQS17336.1 hypothetical protein B0T36_01750 [Nocardia donostiensis]OQS18720.1 hypothetical protein B0T44_17985 [Nocardia donostiensis]
MLHTTSIEDGEATWRMAGSRIEMESFTDYRCHATAYRIRMDGTTVDIPNGRQGSVYFGEDGARPDLALVREWFPKYWLLWDAVKAAYWDTVVPLGYSRCDTLPHPAYDHVSRDSNTEITEKVFSAGRLA